MASDQNSSDPAPECQTMALNHDSLSPAVQRQANVSQADRIVTTSNELDLLFSPMFDELLNRSSKVVSKSSTVSAADAPNQYQRQNHTTPLNNHTTPVPSCQIPTLAPAVISFENINQAETYAENDQVTDDEFINIFSTPVQDQGETSSRHVDTSNMHTFYQRFPSKHRWTKDHRLEQVIGNPSQPVRTRRQLKSDAEMLTEWFSKNKWFESYQYSIRPLPGSKLWKKSDPPKPLPPGERKLPCRPWKRRIRHPSEYDHEISRVGRVMHCHMCWQSGHNKSKCTNAPKPKPKPKPKPDNFYEIPTDE
nr:zinc finger, PMZ-type [Tanacetum cinerariifolium]